MKATVRHLVHIEQRVRAALGLRCDECGHGLQVVDVAWGQNRQGLCRACAPLIVALANLYTAPLKGTAMARLDIYVIHTCTNGLARGWVSTFALDRHSAVQAVKLLVTTEGRVEAHFRTHADTPQNVRQQGRLVAFDCHDSARVDADLTSYIVARAAWDAAQVLAAATPEPEPSPADPVPAA